MSNPIYADPISSPTQNEVDSVIKMLKSVASHANAIADYEKRLEESNDDVARGIIVTEMYDEIKNMGMDLQYVINRKPEYAKILREILFRYGNIIEHAEGAI